MAMEALLLSTNSVAIILEKVKGRSLMDMAYISLTKKKLRIGIEEDSLLLLIFTRERSLMITQS
jgi:hypothetical protein